MSKIIIKNANELVTSAGFKAKKGNEMMDIGVIADGAIVIEDGIIKDLGSTTDILTKYNEQEYKIIDASGKAVLPGFVDSHTHLIFGGYRAEEFSWRLKGDTYMSIMERGGGITNTVNATRETSIEDFISLGKKRLDKMLDFGVTTVEAKSGYGLDEETELKQLKAAKTLNESHAIDIVSTFLGPHSVLPDWKGKEDEFIEYMISVMDKAKNENLMEFADIFCEKNVFSIEQSRKFLTAAKKWEYHLKFMQMKLFN